MNLLYSIALAIVLLLLIYLIIALVKPESFG